MQHCQEKRDTPRICCNLLLILSRNPPTHGSPDVVQIRTSDRVSASVGIHVVPVNPQRRVPPRNFSEPPSGHSTSQQTLFQGFRPPIQISCPSDRDEKTKIEPEHHRRHGSPEEELLGFCVFPLAGFSPLSCPARK